MRQNPIARVALCLLTIVSTASGCGDGAEPGQKPTFKVVGTVTIDGNVPDSSVLIVCYAEKASADSTHEIRPSCMTKPDGSFACTTYRDGDGAPAGDYSLAITWQEINPVTRRVKVKDKLNGRYSDPKKSSTTFTVTNKTVDLGTIELTSK